MIAIRTVHRGLFVAICFLTLSAGVPSVNAQGTQADFQRSRSLPKNVADRVTREQIEPRWRPDGSFWYRVKTAPGGAFEWIDVNPVEGRKTVVINSAELKKATEQLTGAKPAINQLEQLEAEEKNPGQYQIQSAGKWWVWNRATGDLKPNENRVAVGRNANMANGPKASLRQGSETSLTFVNKTGGLAHLQWIDPDGKPKGYGHLQPGESRRQHTFGGHVWRVFDEMGDDLAWIEAEDEPTTVEIMPIPPKKATEQVVAKKKSKRPDKKVRIENSTDFEITDFNIFRKANGGINAVVLTKDGTEADQYRGPLLKSPDGKYLVARRVRPEQKHIVTIIESTPREKLQPNRIEFQYLKPGDQVEQARPVLFDLESNKEIPIKGDQFENPWSIGEWHWAEDSSEFYFLFNQRGHKVVRLVGVNAQTGVARTVVEEKFNTFVDYTNKIWSHWLPGSKKLLWMSERDNWNHLYLVNVAEGKVEKQLTSGPWLVRKIEKVDDKAGVIWFVGAGYYPEQDPYHLHFGRVNFDGSGLKMLTSGDGSHTVTFSPDGKWLFDRYSRVDMPPVHELRSADDGSLKLKLESADATELQKHGWSMPERFVAKGRDGKTDIYGMIYKPANLDLARKYPVVEEIYAGPHGAHVPKSWGLQMRQHQLAELGFIVVQIDGMGTNWRGKAFHDLAAGNLADAGFPDRKLWIREAAKTRPWMDLNRIGIYGGSAGGQNAMRALIDHHDFYKVAVADCGCHDNRMDKIWWNEQWLGWPVGPQYELNSNSAHAHRMNGKLLLIVGELDRNVDPASTMQVVDALVKADKDFELLIIPGAGHGSAETPYGSRRRMDFLVRHLHGVEPRSH